jgi:hypothetical protein
MGKEFTTYSIDRSTGALVKEYVYPQDMGFGMACTDGTEFTFVVKDMRAETLQLVKLAPSSRPGSE